MLARALRPFKAAIAELSQLDSLNTLNARKGITTNNDTSNLAALCQRCLNTLNARKGITTWRGFPNAPLEMTNV